MREASKAGAAAPPMVQPGGANEVLGEIVDPANGNRWVLENGDRPGGPGRLVLASRASAHADRAPERETRRGSFAARRVLSPVNSAAFARPAVIRAPVIRAPVIRAGDRIVLVARTSVMDASLAAVALGPARAGSVFKVRLDIDGRVGGKVLEATALGPGRAEWDVAVGGAWR